MPFVVKKLTPIKTDSLPNLGVSVTDLAKYVEDEFGEVAKSLQATEPDHIWTTAPPRPRRGTIAYADGTHWNPGYGEGFYEYTSAGWVPMFGLGRSLVSPIVTTSYIFQATDAGKLVYFSNTSPIAVSANPATLGSGWWCWVQNYNSGIATITPVSGNIDGAISLHLYAYEKIRLWTDGTNFWTDSHSGEWLPYSPTLSGNTGGTPSGSANVRYKKVRTTVFLQASVSISAIGSATGYVQMTVPVQAGANALTYNTIMGVELSVNGKTIAGSISSSSSAVIFRYYDNSSTLVAGTAFFATGQYEAAI